MAYLFTSESVSEGHPDKVSDQISDALLDQFLRRDPNAKVACETLVTTGLVVLSGEVKTSDYVDVQKIARDTIQRIGYTEAEYRFDYNSCGIISSIHEQSTDINQGVERSNEEDQGAGDQGMMFGYACTETEDYMPLSIDLSHRLLIELAAIRREKTQMNYLRPDSKSQVTIEYGENCKPSRIHTIVISTQHDDFGPTDSAMLQTITDDVRNILIPRTFEKLPTEIRNLLDINYILHVNPTGKFVIGGPHGDTGLTGRKIIVDTYGGKGAHGGGAFSGKDPSKVDRSAAYAARHVAKNMIAAGIATEVLIQVAYAIGVAKPVGFYVNTYGTSKVNMSDGEIAKKVNTIFDMRPISIIRRLKLLNPIYEVTAAYGHLGRKPYKETVTLLYNGQESLKEIEFFTWEKLDFVDQLKAEFDI